MTRKPQTPGRSRPLDRNGDGRDGGSLPGNETAPMAETSILPAGLTAPADGAEATGPTVRDTGILASEISELVRTGNTSHEIKETYPDLTESDIETAVQWAAAEAQKVDQAATAPESWTRDDAAVLEDLQLVDEGFAIEGLTLETVASWSDEQAKEAQAWAAAMGTRAENDAIGSPMPDFLKPYSEDARIGADSVGLGAPVETAPVVDEAFVEYVVNPAVGTAPPTFGVRTNIPDLVIERETLGEAIKAAEAGAADFMREAGRTDEVRFTITPEAWDAAEAARTRPEPDPDDTFTPEEIAAGRTPVVEQEGEAVATAADAAVPADDLQMVESGDPMAQPVAVKLEDLRRLVDNRWLYKTSLGYSPSYSAPWISAEDVAVWIRAGLAEDRPSAGREGGVYDTPKARQLVTQRRAA